MAGTSSPDPCSAPSTEGEARWADRSSPAGRAALVDAYTPLVRRTAARLYARRVGHQELEFGDYLQFGMVGLLEAIDRYTPARGVRFETFASYRIEGAILNGVPAFSEFQRQVHTRRGLLAQRSESLMQAEPATAGSALERLAELAIGLALGFALEDSAMYQDAEASTPDNSYSRVEMKQLRQQLAQLLLQLPDKERLVLTRHYFQQQAFEDIALGLGLTKGRISQIHHAALRALRGKLQAVRALDRSG
jgi:RNA polymerase sigma factor for flagellar operon FliA